MLFAALLLVDPAAAAGPEIYPASVKRLKANVCTEGAKPTFTHVSKDLDPWRPADPIHTWKVEGCLDKPFHLMAPFGSPDILDHSIYRVAEATTGCEDLEIVFLTPATRLVKGCKKQQRYDYHGAAGWVANTDAEKAAK